MFFAAKAARSGRRSSYTGRNDVMSPGCQIDWASLLASHSKRLRTAIRVLVEGGTMREAGNRCCLKDREELKRRITADIIQFFGEDGIRRRLLLPEL